MSSSELFILVIGDDILRTQRILGILHSYSILNAYKIYGNNMPYISDDIGTIIHIDTLEKIQSTLHTMPPHVRYIGYVNGTDEIIGSTNSVGYIGIPISQECVIPPSMYSIQYPHITLVPSMDITKLNHFKTLLGKEVEYEISFPVQTKSVIAHPALIKGEIHHATRGVIHGQYPKQSIIEMEGITSHTYETHIGYPIIM